MTCERCARLCAFREENRKKYPSFFNAPVPNFGDEKAELLIVGLAPGLKGANQTGRPFTNDYAGDLLYPTLAKYGWAAGQYGKTATDGLRLTGAIITNAVRCVPPQNKVTGAEVNECLSYLKKTIKDLPNLKVVLSLGSVSHRSVLKAFGKRLADFPFGHGKVHRLADGLYLVDSYHCSRYNTNTGVLTTQMFEDVFEEIQKIIRHS